MCLFHSLCFTLIKHLCTLIEVIVINCVDCDTVTNKMVGNNDWKSASCLISFYPDSEIASISLPFVLTLKLQVFFFRLSWLWNCEYFFPFVLTLKLRLWNCEYLSFLYPDSEFASIYFPFIFHVTWYWWTVIDYMYFFISNRIKNAMAFSRCKPGIFSGWNHVTQYDITYLWSESSESTQYPGLNWYRKEAHDRLNFRKKNTTPDFKGFLSKWRPFLRAVYHI